MPERWDRTLPELSAATVLYHDDIGHAVRENESSLYDQDKKYTFATLRQSLDWVGVYSDAFSATPPSYSYDQSTDTFTIIPAWAATTAKSVGDWVRPTTANGYIYECVASSGSTDAAEPTWPTTLGDEVTDDGITWRCRGCNVIDMDEDLTSLIKVGMPVRYVGSSSGTCYGICIGISASYLAFAGCPILSNETLTALYFGPAQRVVVHRLWHDGDYDGGAGVDVACEPRLTWMQADAYLVHYKIRHGSNDSTGASANPFVNIEIGGNVVSCEGDGSGNPDKGVQCGGTAAWYEPAPGAIKSANYKAEWGDEVNPVVTTAGTTGDAGDLSAELVFVLE